MIRTFIALPYKPSPGIISTINTLASKINNEKFRWVPFNQWHITLAFIGNTSSETVTKIETILNTISSGFNEIPAEVCGLGVFPNMKNPGVLWLGIVENPYIEALHRKLRHELQNKNIQYDTKTFTPHITVARMRHIKDKDNFKEAIHQAGWMLKDETLLKNINFYESILTSKGAEYSILHSVSGQMTNSR